MKQLIDLDQSNARMRSRCVDAAREAVMVSRIGGSQQEPDLTLPANFGGLGRIRHFRHERIGNWPANPYPGLPAARALGTEFSNVARAQLIQIAGCGMRCWYCFVPYRMLSGVEAISTWLTATELVDLYEAQDDKPQIIVLSGGSPDIAPEWVAWVLEELNGRGLGDRTFLWSDDNLSSFAMLERAFRPHLDVLRRSPNYGKVVCLKGFDEASFSFNTQVSADGFERQLAILDGYFGLGLNLYGYITLTAGDSSAAASGIRRLMDRIQAGSDEFLGRLLPLQVTKYGSMVSRLDPARNASLHRQDQVLELWLEELERRGVSPIWT
jgi:uncharacterized Fe-S cluster-containing radical SAM superfamily protein